MIVPDLRHRWRCPEGGVWAEVTPEDADVVGLSGPLPMRSYRQVPRAELETWVYLGERELPPAADGADR